MPGVHDNPIAFAPLYPRAVADLFESAFTRGLHLPTRRVRESQWRKTLAAAIDSISRRRCGAENVYEPRDAAHAHARTCWACHAPLTLPPRIKLDDHVVLLDRTTELFAHHLGDTRDDSPPVARVVPHPRRPDLFGLRHLGQDPWTLTKRDGTTAQIPPGKSASILDGHRLDFGRVTGLIRA